MMQVTCTKCQGTTDLTEFNVGIGHVFDCEDCNEPLRALHSGDAIVGVPIVDIPRPIFPANFGDRPRNDNA